jgi:hypothetical protein
MLVAVSGSVTAAEIDWKNDGALIEASMMEAPARVLERVAGQERRMIAEFDAIPTSGQRAALKAAGVEVLAPLGGSAYFVRIDADVDAGTAIRAASIAALGDVQRAHKIDSKLMQGTAPAWALAEVMEEQARAEAVNPTIGVYVQMHRDVAISGQTVADLIADHGGVIRDKVASVNTLVVEMPFLAVEGLADDDRVQWVEAALPRMGTFNADNRVRVQADTAHAAPYSLDGSGVTVFVYDGGTVRASHNDYSGRATLIDGDSTSFHATHVAGTVGGRRVGELQPPRDGTGRNDPERRVRARRVGHVPLHQSGRHRVRLHQRPEQSGRRRCRTTRSAPTSRPTDSRARSRATTASRPRRSTRSWAGRWVSPSSSSGPRATSGATARCGRRVQHDAAPVEQQERDLRRRAQLQRRLGDRVSRAGAPRMTGGCAL